VTLAEVGCSYKREIRDDGPTLLNFPKDRSRISGVPGTSFVSWSSRGESSTPASLLIRFIAFLAASRIKYLCVL